MVNEIKEKFKEEINILYNMLSKAENIKVYYHMDLDGITSAIIFHKFMKREDIEYKPCTLQLDLFVKDLSSYDLNLFLDLPDSYEYLSKNVFIIDHHPTEIKENIKQIINPHIKGISTPYSCSKVIYDIFEEENTDWIALLGLYGDNCDKYWEDFKKEVLNKYNISESNFKKIVEYLNSTIIVEGRTGSKIIFEFLKRYDNPKDVLENISPFKKIYNRLQREIKKLEELFELQSEIYNNIVLFEVKSDLPLILSYFSTYIHNKYPDYILFFYSRKKSGEYIFSCRSSKVNLLKLLNDISKNVKIDFGGHKQACGIRIKGDSNFLKFKRELLKICRNLEKYCE